MSHDPEELVTLNDLSPGNTNHSPSPPHLTPSKFYPYPNESSFRLGNWHWEGLLKSHSSFDDLLKIVGNTNYRPEDVRETNWKVINCFLGHSADSVVGEEDQEDQPEWMDEDVGWKKTRVSISVPFNNRMSTTGVCNYANTVLNHRPLVQVIKEWLADPHNAAQFHMEPYKLLWQPTSNHQEVQVHGELYTSPAFIQAHRELQGSLREPDCDLQRVVVSLMFWWDSTHLTSFGNAHLWPCYLYVGNESKYRRCKPSANLCSHVAYFESVCPPFLYISDTLFHIIFSYWTSSKASPQNISVEKVQTMPLSPIVAGNFSTPKLISCLTTSSSRHGSMVLS